MTLLFIENRHKTYLLEIIAKQLAADGHEVHWIIQNRMFIPQGDFHVHKIKYPKHKKLNGFKKNQSVENVINSDRQVNHFKKQDTSYFYYYNSQIKELLKTVKPDLVFGESTAFHELLTINNCRDLDIIYLNPSTCRYPVGRFSFYKYDTLEPYEGSQEHLSKDDASAVIDSIIYRKAVPDYMKPAQTSALDKIKDQLKKIYAYVDGERYNTPNPIVKYKIEKQKISKIENWDAISVYDVIEDSSFKVLYPLQMQPEANIDVWGRKYRDQTKLVETISNQLPQNAILYVKPNPKSKYELNDSLYQLVKDRDNIVVLNHNTKMDEVLKDIDLVITVTGTIAIECILNNKPVVNLIETVNNKSKNCTFINSINDLEDVITKVKKESYIRINEQEKMDFINVLNSTSYKGIISDPFTDGNCVSKSNTNDILNAFKDVLNKYSGKQH